MKSDSTILEKELSYILYGIFIKIGKDYGCFYKERLYQIALMEELTNRGIKFVSQPKIKVISKITDKPMGYFVPDIVVDEKIIVEIKAQKQVHDRDITQLIKYLQQSKYQVGYLVNFGAPYTQIIRRVYSK